MKTIFQFAGFVVVIVAFVASVWRRKASLAVGGGFAGIILVLCSNVDRIEALTASPGKIQATLSEARASLDQLRALAVITAKSLIQLREEGLAGAILGSDAGDIYAAQDAYKASVLQSLKDMGVFNEAIKGVGQSDSKVVVDFYAYAAYRFARDPLPQDQIRAFDTAWNEPGPHALPDQIESVFNASMSTSESSRSTSTITATTYGHVNNVALLFGLELGEHSCHLQESSTGRTRTLRRRCAVRWPSIA